MSTMSTPHNMSSAKQPPAYSPAVYHPASLGAAAVLAIAAAACILLIVAVLYLRRVTRRLDAAVARNAKQPRVRLEPSAVAALPTITYRANHSDGRASSDRCAVCLTGMSDGDLMRLLPACRHEFHVRCIDRWLLACATCPVCRAEVRPAATAAARAAGQSTATPSPTPHALPV